MKRVICAILAACLLLGAAGLAESKTYEIDDGSNGYFVCEDFTGGMTQKAKGIFSGLMREGDEVIAGTLFQEHYHNAPGKLNRGGALMAVRRADRILLMSANTNGGIWSAGVETDGFLPPDAQFSITTKAAGRTYAHLTILYRDTAYEIRTTATGGAYLYEYSWTDEAGRTLHMDCYHGKFVLREQDGNGPLAEGRAVPDRLCAWTADSLPKTEADIREFEQKHPLALSGDEAFITGVNLRERATGQSPSWGVYSAKVDVLGEQQGKQAPWVNVRLGELEGWVSGDYLHRQGKGDQMHIYSTAVMVHAVGRAKAETALARTPGGESVMQLAAGSYVHVLGERDGYLHVIVPHGEITWQTDWDGTYGFVKAQDMTVGVSKADAAYRE